MKQHFCPVEKTMIGYEGKCNWCGELESQEPVAWMSEDEYTVYTSKQVDGCFQHDHIPLYSHPPQPAKPIPCANNCEATAFEIVIKNLQGEIERLKAPQRTWVGLTDEEICLFSMWLDSKPDATVFTAIEAKLKEKNS